MIAKVKIHDKYAFAFVKIVCTFARLNPYKELSMKRLTVMFFILLAIVSCKKNEPPTISVSPATATLTTDGGTVNATVTAGGTWTASCSTEGVTISPASAQGNSPVSISVPANTTGMSRTIKVIFTCTDGGNNTTVTISQEFYEEAISLKYSENHKENWDFEGGVEEITVECNYPWTSTVSGTITVSPTSGEKGTTKVTVTIPKNKELTEASGSLNLIAKSLTQTSTREITYIVMAPYLTYGNANYPLVKLKDGNIWMAENLRYVPEGITPSSDLTNVKAGIYNPVKLNDGHTALVFTDDAAVVMENGYLYQSEVALGLKVGDITSEDQAKALEGTRGICPEGWHIPTATEIINLVGKAVSPYETKTDAPYYDAEKGNATIDKLNEDKFNAGAWGAVTILDNTKASGTIMGYLKKTPDMISSGYVCGSTYTGKTEKDGKIINFQFLGFMPMANNGTFNGAKLSYRIGASVRCVKDAKKTE